jgi:hypothetical protein
MKSVGFSTMARRLHQREERRPCLCSDWADICRPKVSDATRQTPGTPPRTAMQTALVKVRAA